VSTASRRAIVWVAFTAAGVGPIAGASADEALVPVRIDYRGTERCSDGAEFLRELLARDPRVRTASPEERAPVLVVSVTRGARQAVHGRLVVEDVDGTSSRRDVDGDGCESVLGALALMAAIAVDPAAPLRGDDAPGAAPGAAPSSSPGRGDGVEGARPVAGASSKDEVSPAGGIAPEAGRSSLHFGVTGGASATMGTAPTVAWMIPVSAEIGWGLETSVSPLVRAGFEHADSGEDAATGGDARFVLNAGTLDLCASFPVTRAVSLLPCLHAEGGTLLAAGSDIQPARSDTRPWLGLGAVGAVRYLVRSPVFVELSFGVRLPLVRDRFFFEPDTTVFQPPVAAGFAGGCIGFTIL
jgi:hypothetical protein